MKRISFIKYFLVLICLCLVGVTCVNAAVANVEISGKNEIKVGESTQLKVVFHTSGGDLKSNDKEADGESVSKNVTKEVVWSTPGNTSAVDDSDNFIDPSGTVKISNDGIVTGLKSGTVTITADYQGTTENYQITVKEKDNRVLVLAIVVGCSLLALGAGIYILKSQKER